METHGQSVDHFVISRSLLFGQFSGAEAINVPEITVVRLDKILAQKCGDEESHPYLDETRKVTLNFLRAAIDFMEKEECQFYFSQLLNGNIHGRCLRKPTLHYTWDEFKKVISLYVVTLVVLALTAS